jgi:hypothetical protein
MTEDLVMLQPVQEKGLYKGKTCKIEDCENPPRRNWLCEKHSSAVREGRMKPSGEKIWKRASAYRADFECIVHGCGRRGKIVKGFCRRHYGHYSKGIIDFDGSPLRPLKRVQAYSPLDQCKVQSCRKRPRVRGFCATHAEGVSRGAYDESGKRLTPRLTPNKGKKCKEAGCESEAHCKGLCVLHYNRERTGYLGPEGFKNVGQKCSNEKCERPAHCRTLCTKHYHRWKRRKVPPPQAILSSASS